MKLSFNKNYIIGFPPSDICNRRRSWISFGFISPKLFGFPVFGLLTVPDEGYSRNVPDEGYSRNVPDEGYPRSASSTLNLIPTSLLLSI